MSDSDNTLEFLIKIGLIGQSDAQAAKDLLNETKNSAHEFGRETNTLAGETSEATKAAEKFTLANREGGHILREVGEQIIPGAGRALSELRLGLIGVGLAVGEVFAGIREKIAKTNEDLDAMGEKASEAFANVKTNLFDAIRNEEFSTDKIDKFFKKIEDDARRAQTAIESALRLAHEFDLAKDKKLGADEANELALIDTDQTLTPDQKKEKAAKVKSNYAALRAQREMQGQQDEVNAAQAELTQKQNELQGLQNQLPDPFSGVSPEQKRANDAAALKDAETEMASLQAKLGLDEQTGAREKGGDADKAFTQKAKLQGILDKINGGELSRNTLNFSELRELTGQQNFVTGSDWAKAAGTIQDQIAHSGDSIKADQDRIEQLKNHSAELKQAAARDKELNEKIAALIIEVDAAAQKLKETTAIAGIRNDATQYTTKETAQTDKLKLLKDLGLTPDQVIQNAATATDDISRLHQQGYSDTRILGEGDKAKADKAAGRQFDQGAIDRLAEFKNDQRWIYWLNTLLETIHGNQSGMIDLIKQHQQRQISLAQEVAGLQQQFRSARLRTQSMPSQGY
jgi:hypothetical protein